MRKNPNLNTMKRRLLDDNKGKKALYNWAPLTTGEVKRSFSKYTLIYSTLRKSLAVETIFDFFFVANSL